MRILGKKTWPLLYTTHTKYQILSSQKDPEKNNKA